MNFPISPLTLSRSHWACLAILAALLTVASAGFNWQYEMLTNQKFTISTEDLQTQLARQSPSTPLPQIGLNQLQRLALMGKVEVAQPLAPPELEEIPESTQMLELSGVFAGHGTLAAALIKVDGSSPKYFTIGSEVTSGTQLFAVTNNGVTLKSENGYEKLIFKRNNIWAISTANTLPSADRPATIELVTASAARPTAKAVKEVDYNKPQPITYLPNAPLIADGTLEQRLNQIRDVLKRQTQ